MISVLPPSSTHGIVKIDLKWKFYFYKYISLFHMIVFDDKIKKIYSLGN